MAKPGRPPKNSRLCKTCDERKDRAQFVGSSGKRCTECRDKSAAARCVHCGGPSGYRKGHPYQPRTYCTAPACARARAIAGGKASKPAPPPRLKRCPNCHGNFPRTEEFWSAARRNPDGTIKTLNGYCKACDRAIQRDRYWSNEAFRQRRIARSANRLRLENERRAVDPEFDAQIRAKLADKARRRRVRDKPKVPKTRQPAGPEIPVGPLLQFVDGVVKREGLEFGTNAPHSANQTRQEVVCERLGVDPRRLSAWRSGEAATTRADLADRVMTNAGAFWWEVWPEGSDGHEAARAAFGDPELHPVD